SLIGDDADVVVENVEPGIVGCGGRHHALAVIPPGHVGREGRGDALFGTDRRDGFFGASSTRSTQVTPSPSPAYKNDDDIVTPLPYHLFSQTAPAAGSRSGLGGRGSAGTSN